MAKIIARLSICLLVVVVGIVVAAVSAVPPTSSSKSSSILRGQSERRSPAESRSSSSQFIHQGVSYDPVPNPEAVVTTGAARFTVLTSQLIRIEYSRTRNFTDSPSLSVLNRRLPVPKFTTTQSPGGWFVLTTSDLELHYYGNLDAPFNSTTLRVVVYQVGDRRNVNWSPGTSPSGNLGGTIRTLDGCSTRLDLTCSAPSWKNDTHCEPGLISRDGWAIMDDSDRPRFVEQDNWLWTQGPFQQSPAPSTTTCAVPNEYRSDCNPGDIGGQEGCEQRSCCYAPVGAEPTRPPRASAHQSLRSNHSATNSGAADSGNGIPWCFYPEHSVSDQYVDWYFFGYGHNYLSALSDYTKIGGSIPLPPRYALGPQFSRWYAYDDLEEIDIVEDDYAGNNIPLDVLVIDMDWHFTYDRPVVPNPHNISIEGWSGYTFDTHLFPVPSSFLDYLRRRNIYVTLNLHPGAGVQFIEALYPEMAKAMGLDPSTDQTIPFNITDLRYASNFMNIVMAPLQPKDGVQFWWLDWQQGESTFTKNVNPTFWLNHVFNVAPLAWPNNERPWLMGRWGGMGNHRYPIGFSGDTTTSWEVLGFEVVFSATASNVLYQWSHDIGGFFGQPDPELYVRWVQFGLFSSALRTHTDGKANFHRNIWLYPYENFRIMRDAFQTRSELVPYLYTSNYVAFSTGVPVIRSLYLHYPDDDRAYKYPGQYFFGPSIMVSPVTAPVSAKTNLTAWPVFIPSGVWFDWNYGELVSSASAVAQELNRNYSLSEVPAFVPAGTLLPLNNIDRRSRGQLLGSATPTASSLLLDIFPPLTAGSSLESMWYDDDGFTTDYLTSSSTKTLVTTAALSVSADQSTLQLYTSPRSSGKSNDTVNALQFQRTYTIRVRNIFPPAVVSVVDASGATRVIPFDAYGYPDRMVDSNGIPIDVWVYDPLHLDVYIQLATPISTAYWWALKVEMPSGVLVTDALPKQVPFARAIDRVQHCKRQLETTWGRTYTQDYYTLLDIPGSVRRIQASTSSATVRAELQSLRSRLSTAIGEIRGLPLLSTQEDIRSYCLGLLEDVYASTP